MSSQNWIIPAAVACAASFLLTAALIRFLRRRAILDLPNQRSLHSIPKPRGGGIAVLAGFVAGLFCSGFDIGTLRGVAPLICGTVVLVAVSGRDDVKSLSALPRFGAQIFAVALGLQTLHGHVFQGWLPTWLDYSLAALAWLWFVNLFNFMDGMDGLCGGEALAIAFGLFLMAPHPAAAIVFAASVLGFLAWNWAPSKIMLGDIGSIPFGYLLGGWLLHGAELGNWAAALLLPLYFLVDATITLGKRLARREQIWKPHRQHFYQFAVLSGRSHRQVAIAVYILDTVLLFCAVALSPAHPAGAVALGLPAVALLLLWMRSRSRQASE